MLSIIIQEHNETPGFVEKMVEQINLIPEEKELLMMTSMSKPAFEQKYNALGNNFPIRIYDNVQNLGDARTIGGLNAYGDTLIYFDCHVCFTYPELRRLLDTLDRHPTAIVGPAIVPVEYPSCIKEAEPGHGVCFTFKTTPFQWTWLPPDTKEHEYLSPFICGCLFVSKKQTMINLAPYGGFLKTPSGLGIEEVISMRLARIGHPTFVDPTVELGHLFKGHPGKPQWDSHSTASYYYGRIAELYVNVFDQELWNHIENNCKEHWGQEWDINLPTVIKNFRWLRNKLEPFKNNINENWYFRR